MLLTQVVVVVVETFSRIILNNSIFLFKTRLTAYGKILLTTSFYSFYFFCEMEAISYSFRANNLFNTTDVQSVFFCNILKCAIVFAVFVYCCLNNIKHKLLSLLRMQEGTNTNTESKTLKFIFIFSLLLTKHH